MKKYNILKVLGITFLTVVVLSWIIPAGTYSSGTYQSVESTVPVSLYTLFRLPIVGIGTFIQYGLMFLVIGGFYGVFAKTGVYTKLVEKFTKSQKNSKIFIYLVAGVFAFLSAMTALPNLLFVFVPFFITVLTKLGYNKLTTFSATIGALLVGQIGNLLGFNIWGYFVYFFDVGMFEAILIRIVVFIVVTALFMLMLKNDKKETKEETLEIPLYKEVKTKKSSIPFVVTGTIFLVLLIIGLYNWSIGYEIEFFTNIYTSIMEFEVNGYQIMNNVFGDLPDLGFWGNYELATTLFILTFLIGWLYSLKLDEIIESFSEGVKKMLPTALLATLASLVFAIILNSQFEGTSANFVNTIMNNLMQGTDPGVFSVGFSSIIGSFAYNDFYNFTQTYGALYSVADNISGNLVMVQMMTGLVMLIAPVSVYLIAGLTYMDIKYSAWFKHIWKFLLYIFIFTLILGFLIA